LKVSLNLPEQKSSYCLLAGFGFYTLGEKISPQPVIYEEKFLTIFFRTKCRKNGESGSIRVLFIILRVIEVLM